MIFSGKKLGPIFLQSFTSPAIAQPPGTSCEKKADKKKSFFSSTIKYIQNIRYTVGHTLLRAWANISITISFIVNLPSLILAAMTRMRIMMMRQLTRVIFLRLCSVWDTQPPDSGLLTSSPEITPSTSGAESEMRKIFSSSGFLIESDDSQLLSWNWFSFYSSILIVLVSHWRSSF